MDVQAAGITIFIAVGKTAMKVIDNYFEAEVCLHAGVSHWDHTRNIMIAMNHADKEMILSGTYPGSSRRIDMKSADEMPNILWHELDCFLKKAASVVTSGGNLMPGFHMDVVVAGNVDDTFFLENFLNIAVTVEELVHDRYNALVSVKGGLENASFILLPVAFSENLHAEKYRKEILSMIVGAERWEARLETTRKCIPRFFIFDGFTRNGKIGFDDQIAMVSNLIVLLTDAGIRNTEEMKRLFGFPVFPEGFLSILSIATASFPTHQLSDYCCSVSLLKFFDGLLENPRGTNDKEMNALFEEAATLLTPAFLEQTFTDAGSGFDLVATLAQVIPTFAHYHNDPTEKSRDFWEKTLPASKEEKLIEEPEVSRLRIQETYLPRISWKDTPEDLADFFNASWQEYPVNELTRTSNTGAAELFDAYHEAIDACGMTLQERVESSLRGSIDVSLSLNAGGRRLGATLEYLKDDLLVRIKKTIRDWEEKTGFLSLPDVPNMDTFISYARRFRNTIWNRAAYKSLLIWLPMLSFLFFLAFTHLIPIGAAFVTQDPLDVSLFVRIFRPPLSVPVSFGLSLLLVLLPLLFYNLRIGSRLRRYMQSEYPYQTMLSRKERELSQGRESAHWLGRLRVEVEKLKKKIPKMMKRRGILARRIAEGQRDGRIYWQSRLKLTTYIWIKRILFMAKDIIEEEIDRLDRLRMTITNHRSIIIDNLRNAGYTPENPDKCTMIPPSTPFSMMLLGNDALRSFAERQRSIREDAALMSHFIVHFGLFKNWRSHSLLDRLDLLFSMAGSLYPAFSAGLFTVNDQTGRIKVQVNDFFADLDDRLSGGDQFRFFASLQENETIYDSGFFIFCHSSATHLVKDAMRSHAIGAERLVNTSFSKNRSTAIRILKDLSTDVLLGYFGYQSEDISDQRAESADEDIWNRLRRRPRMEIRDA